MTYSYQWERCDINGANCVDIAGEVSANHINTSSDVGHTLRGRVTDGVSTVTSAPTPVIQAASVENKTGIGTIRLGSSYASGTHYESMHSVIVGVGDVGAAVALTNPMALWYVSGIQVERNTFNRYITGGIDIGIARTNGWLMTKGGRELGYSIDPTTGLPSTSLADISNVAYQNAWASSVINFLRSNGLQGIHVDNFEIDLLNFSATVDGNGIFTYAGDQASNASQSAFANAQIAFAANALKQVKDAGFYVLVNGAAFIAGNNASNDGTLTKQWVDRYAPYVTGMEVEYWLTTDGSSLMRNSGDVGPFPFWEGWTDVQTHVESLGLRFHGLVYGGATDVARCLYGRGSFMLNWNGVGGEFSWGPTLDADNWNSSMAITPGLPTAAKTQPQTGVFKRTYANGTIYVNSTINTVSVDGHTLGPVSALWV